MSPVAGFHSRSKFFFLGFNWDTVDLLSNVTRTNGLRLDYTTSIEISFEKYFNSNHWPAPFRLLMPIQTRSPMFNAGLWPDQASNHCAGTRNSQCGPTRCWRGWGCSAVVINALADALALAAWPRRLLLLQKENFVMKRFPNYFAKIKGKNMRNGIQCHLILGRSSVKIWSCQTKKSFAANKDLSWSLLELLLLWAISWNLLQNGQYFDLWKVFAKCILICCLISLCNNCKILVSSICDGSN